MCTVALGKTRILSTDFNHLTFWPRSGFDLVLYLDVVAQLITPVISVEWILSFSGASFDMLKSMQFRNLVGLLLSLRFDQVYKGWFLWDSVERLFQTQALRWSMKAHYGFGFTGSSLSTEFKVYLCKCWVVVCEFRLYGLTYFLLCSVFLVLTF